MIQKISDIFKTKEKTYSFEFFPPKTKEGVGKLYETAGNLCSLKPDFFSVTYGAGGSTRELTMEIVDELQKKFAIPTMHHFTCIGHSKAELRAIIETMKEKNICNILALRGDPPQGETNWKPSPDGLEYAYQLCQLIKSVDYDFFSIAVAGFPESHINCPDKETDTKYLKMKIDSGACFVITQLFFENKDYLEYLERTRNAGITARIIPGILPITNYQALIRFCKTCGATIPNRVHSIFKPLEANEEETYKRGIEFAVKQCEELLSEGSPGLHFFTLNKVNPTAEILNKIKVCV